MSFFQSFIIINLLIWIPWIWIYKVRPYFAKAKINRELANNVEWQQLQKVEKLLITLYQNVNSYRISRKELKRLSIQNDDFIYGEIVFLSFYLVLQKAQPKSGEIFCDLGSGSGKAVFAAMFFFDLSKAYGFELLPGLFQLANQQLEKVKSLISNDNTLSNEYLDKVSHIQFFNQNFLEADFADADIVYINATCLHSTTWEKIIEKLLDLKVGSRVIVNSKKISHDKFKLIDEAGKLMSWGLSMVRIYKKVS